MSRRKGNGQNGTPAPARKIGRPAWEPNAETREVLLRAYALGMTIEQLAHIGGCARSTFYEYAERHPEFSDAIKGERVRAGLTVLRNLYQMATGTHPTQMLPVLDAQNRPVMDENGRPRMLPGTPDRICMIFYSKAVLGMRDRIMVEGNPEQPITHAVDHKFSLEEQSHILAILAQSAQAKPEAADGDDAAA